MDDIVQVPSFLAHDFVYKIAHTPFELDGFWELRRAVFCEEQQVFTGNDRDAHDPHMIPIVCISLLAGMEDQVVGVVRIDEREPGVWWGSRLAVHPDHRHNDRLSASVSQRNRQPRRWGQRSIGAGLIYKAVSTAHALGCETFLAQVQVQNAPFFRRLHWNPLREIEAYGFPHVEMEADLRYYPPASPAEMDDLRSLLAA